MNRDAPPHKKKYMLEYISYPNHLSKHRSWRSYNILGNKNKETAINSQIGLLCRLLESTIRYEIESE